MKTKKIVLLLCVLLLLFIVGCVSKQFVCSDGKVVKDVASCNPITGPDAEEAIKSTENDLNIDVSAEPAVQKEPEQKPIETPQQEVKPVLTLTQAQKDTLKSKLVHKKTAVYPTTLGANDPIPVEGTYTYAFAIKNTGVKPALFKHSIKLLEAKTESLSKLGADDTVVEWFSPHTKMEEQYELSKNEIAYIPLVIVVGDRVNKEDLPTFAGTYKFRIKTETVDGPFDRDYHYVDFTFRVK